MYLTNIEITHPGSSDLLKRGAIAVARSFIPGSLCAVDKTMEETFMRFAQTAGIYTQTYLSDIFLFHNIGIQFNIYNFQYLSSFTISIQYSVKNIW